ncbi:MAG: T9SS type A sorting domain-containing protein [Flavobacteriales bacterium]
MLTIFQRASALTLAGCSCIAVLAQPGSLDPTFNLPGYTYAQPSSMVALPNGSSILAGYFDNGSDPPFMIGRFLSDGSLDPSFQVGSTDGFGAIYDIARQSDGKILVGGQFTGYEGTGHPYLVRLNADGSVDNTFDYVQSTGPFSHWVEVVSMQADGKVLIAGALEYNGTYPPLKRLLSDGSNDAAFMTAMGTGPNGVGMSEMIEQGDGSILIAGGFTSVSGNARDKFARLLPSGQVDATFVPTIPVPSNVGGKFVTALLLQPDGKSLVAAWYHLDQSGNFEPGARLIRYLTDGSIDPGWSVTVDNSIHDMVLATNGSVVLGGEFTDLSGTSKSFIARLDATGQVDPAYPSGAGPDAYISEMERQYDGRILLSGGFTTYDGVARPGWARLLDCYLLSFELQTDANGGETSWEVLNGGDASIECSGDGFASNSGCLASECCVSAGTHVLNVHDAGTGMTGSYQLRASGHGRIVHNSEGFAGTLAQHGTDGSFSTDMGTDHLVEQSCDANGLTATGYVRAASNSDVAAQVVPPGTWSLQPYNSGYEFWFFDPDGGYSKTVYQSLRVLNGQGGANANARYLKLNHTAFTSDPLPLNKTLNVRVRARVVGVNNDWGPACRIKVNGTTDAYWETHLVDLPGDPFNSCDVTMDFDPVGVDNVIYAVRRIGSLAYHYRFRWERVSDGSFFFVDRTSGSLDNNRFMVLSRTNVPSYMPNWPAAQPDPLPGDVFIVRVATKKAGTNTWSAFGPCCTVTIGGGQQMLVARTAPSTAGSAFMELWPNPNHDGQLNLAIGGLDDRAGELHVDIIDAMGRSTIKWSTQLGANGRGTVLDLSGAAPGLYVVRASLGTRTFTERVVLE